jgi:hypothetical protein
MAKRYSRINWQDFVTKITSVRLNIMDKAIDDCDNSIEDLYNVKVSKADLVQSDAIGGTDKAPSAEVTKALSGKITALQDMYIGSHHFGVIMTPGIDGTIYSTSIAIPSASSYTIAITAVALTGVRQLTESEWSGKINMYKYKSSFRIFINDSTLITLLAGQIVDFEFTLSR